uniref:FecCD family ABC transporter permease n=1 Tax=Candidatus Electronema sp. TaxID=2698783 RepID=UPI00405635AF
MPSLSRRPPVFSVLLALLTAALLVSLVIALSFGPSKLPASTVWAVALKRVTGLELGAFSPAQEHIVLYLRFPRVFLAAVVGAGLAAVGVILQAIVRNPMADPYIIGVSPGAAVGAVLALMLGWGDRLGQGGLSAAAFGGGLLAFAAVGLMAWRNGRLTPSRVILAGVAVSYLFTSLSSFLILSSAEHIPSQAILYWLMGSVAGARWDQLGLPALLAAGGSVYAIASARQLNLIALGDETACSLGVNPHLLRLKLMTLAALLTGVLVSVSGGVGFVALMVPHAVRLVAGGDHRRLLPLAVLTGAVFLIWVDLAARLLIQPAELPLTIVTAFVGTPFFLCLLRRKERGLSGDSL